MAASPGELRKGERTVKVVRQLLVRVQLCVLSIRCMTAEPPQVIPHDPISFFR